MFRCLSLPYKKLPNAINGPHPTRHEPRLYKPSGSNETDVDMTGGCCRKCAAHTRFLRKTSISNGYYTPRVRGDDGAGRCWCRTYAWQECLSCESTLAEQVRLRLRRHVYGFAEIGKTQQHTIYIILVLFYPECSTFCIQRLLWFGLVRTSCRSFSVWMVFIFEHVYTTTLSWGSRSLPPSSDCLHYSLSLSQSLTGCSIKSPSIRLKHYRGEASVCKHRGAYWSLVWALMHGPALGASAANHQTWVRRIGHALVAQSIRTKEKHWFTGL